ncbi:TPA_asm: hypothetical protein [Bos-associated insect adintovirus]|uniref:Uncharacterized protein n=1 Tax=Bos-associated insect adintovirus TaxID=2597806 RepID=A0A5H3CT76_9VIRU|nr:TPA_asm: hypothetical protein [Bos-associated insect adintovirus]
MAGSNGRKPPDLGIGITLGVDMVLLPPAAFTIFRAQARAILAESSTDNGPSLFNCFVVSLTIDPNVFFPTFFRPLPILAFVVFFRPIPNFLLTFMALVTSHAAVFSPMLESLACTLRQASCSNTASASCLFAMSL